MAKRGRRRRPARQTPLSPQGSQSDTTDEGADVDIMSDAKRPKMDAEEEIDVEHSNSCPASPVFTDEADHSPSHSDQDGAVMEGTEIPVDGTILPDGTLLHLDVDGVRVDPFDPTSDMHDLLLNASADSLMDIPLFNEVDSLMNIKHEDHLIDSVFYLPSSYSYEPNLKLNMSETGQLPESVLVDKSVVCVDDRVEPGLQPIVIEPLSKSMHKNKHARNTIRNSTDILGNNFPVSNDGARALEHILMTDTGSSKTGRQRGQAKARSRRKVSNASTASEEILFEENKVYEEVQQENMSVPDDMLPEIPSEDADGFSDGEESPEGSPDPSEAETMMQPEIDRFVICSDHTMECVLCSFTTDSYSAFKSHIICSHPCWRITKKLSKNRLLVEKAVRGGSSLNLLLPAYHNRCSSGACTKDKTVKPQRKCERSARKRQMFERNKRLFRCTVCLRLFVFEGSVVNHVTENHCQKDRPYDYIHISNDHGQTFGPIYRCQKSNCYFSCESADELERHGLEQHTAVIYRCQLCGYTADSAAAVHAHGLRMHQQQLTCFC